MSSNTKEFWAWFLTEPATWAVPGDDFDEEELMPLYDKLEEHFPELTPNVSWQPDEHWEIEFCAKLNPSMAPLIRKIVAEAPALESWRFVAFGPPLGFSPLYVAHLGLLWEQMPVDEILVERRPHGPTVALTVYLPDYDDSLREGFDTAVRLLLEAGMGEAWLLEQLGDLQLADRSEAPEPAIVISELGSTD